jgi:hypothetical protein
MCAARPKPEGGDAKSDDQGCWKMNPPPGHSSLLWWVGAAAGVGLGVFAFLAWRSVTVEQATPDVALQRFTEVRKGLAVVEPMLRVDAAGQITRRDQPSAREAAYPTRLRALAYRAPEHRLVRADVPFWFFKIKGPAAQYALCGTGLDLDHLGLTPADLQRCGVCLVLDETRTNGDRLLVWTE